MNDSTIFFRKPEPGDLDALYRQKNDPEVKRLLGGFGNPMSRRDLEEWLEWHRTRKDELLWSIVRESNGQCLGHVGLYKIDPVNRSAEFGIMIGDREAWGKGYGREATRYALDYAFAQLNLRRVSLTVMATNERALRLYRSIGFVEEGVLRQAQYRDGDYVDLVYMAVVRTEPLCPQPKESGSGERWEVGSDFHLMEFGEGGDPRLPRAAGHYGSGRDALRDLVRFGAGTMGWRTLWAPRYFCQTVLRDLRSEIEILAYGDGPLDDPDEPIEIPDDLPGAVLALNPFGLRSRMRPVKIDRERHWLIEDHSHDPWSPLATESNADACVVSLRKTVPLPDGGLLWSPVGRLLPTEPPATEARIAASAEKLAGMALKARYLSGARVEKEEFRKLLLLGEAGIASGEVSGMTSVSRAILRGFPADAWRRARKQNYETLRALLSTNQNVTPLRSRVEDNVPFAMVVRLPSREIRDAVRAELNDKKVYTAVLWSMDDKLAPGIRQADIELSEQMLSLHCDGRYGASDMVRAEELLSEVLNRNGTSRAPVKRVDAVASLR